MCGVRAAAPPWGRSTPGPPHTTLHYTALHYTTLHYTTLQIWPSGRGDIRARVFPASALPQSGWDDTCVHSLGLVSKGVFGEKPEEIGC